jgi:adenine phosphoribosyltransferase
MLKDYIKEVPDFPKKGINYKDIQPLLADQEAFFDALYEMGQLIDVEKVDYFVGIESRGFIFASALAAMNLRGFKMIRKAGKLPNQKNLVSFQYDLEYGSDTIEMEKGKGSVIIVDDVYATGGTMQAAKELCVEAGYNVLDTVCLLDIGLVKDHDTKVLLNAT